MANKTTYSNAFAVFTATGRILSMFCSFVMPLFLTRFLTKEDYGSYAQFYTIVTFVASIATFGMQSNLYYFCPRCGLEKQKTVLGNTLVALFAFAIIAFVIVEVPGVNHWLIRNGQLRQYVHLVGICIFFYVPSYIMYPLLVLRKDKVLSVVFPPLEIILKVVLVIAASLMFGTLKAIFVSVVILQAIIFVATMLYSFVCGRKSILSVNLGFVESYVPWFDMKLMKTQLSYIVPFGLSIALFTVFRQFDKILCIRYVTPEQYAIYSLAFFGIPGIQQIYDSVCEVNLLNMTKCYKDGDFTGTLAQYKSFCVKMFSFTLPLILIVCVFSKEIIVTLFTEKYIDAVPFFQVYIFSFVIGTLGAGTVLRATGDTRYTLLAYLCSLPFYGIIAYFGIKHCGLWGAMTAAMLGVFLPKCIQIFFEIRVLKSNILDYMPWKEMGLIFAISSVGLMPIVAIIKIFNLSILCCAIIAVAYIVAIYSIEILKDVFMFDRNSLLTLLGRFTKKGNY